MRHSCGTVYTRIYYLITVPSTVLYHQTVATCDTVVLHRYKYPYVLYFFFGVPASTRFAIHRYANYYKILLYLYLLINLLSIVDIR